jgi:hypothetical protein
MKHQTISPKAAKAMPLAESCGQTMSNNIERLQTFRTIVKPFRTLRTMSNSSPKAAKAMPLAESFGQTIVEPFQTTSNNFELFKPFQTLNY